MRTWGHTRGKMLEEGMRRLDNGHSVLVDREGRVIARNKKGAGQKAYSDTSRFSAICCSLFAVSCFYN